MRFVWFWTFWHWSKESFRAGTLLRSPLHGVGGHWDEWFRYEASDSDRRAIETAGQTELSQRQFMNWLFRHWAHETEWRGNRMVSRFVLGQLAQVPPFNQWRAFARYQAAYGVRGISAIVLGEESPGEAEDVRRVEALVLPADGAQKIVAEEFQADVSELDPPRRAAMSSLAGKGLVHFLLLWTVGGNRPYPPWLKVSLGLGWLTVGALILHLLLGPDPGERLLSLSQTLVALWCGLVLIALAMAGTQSLRAWRQGQRWVTGLAQVQVRLRMTGGLTLKGESAGLPFCLNTMLSVYRADPGAVSRSWLWRRFFSKLHSEAASWAATGVVTSDGYLKPVVMEPKLRACLQREDITHILTPRQRGAGRQFITRLAAALPRVSGRGAPGQPRIAPARLGFAAVGPRLRSHRCRHVAQAMMALGDFTNGWQKAVSALAVVVSCAMLFALPDLRAILVPPPVPAAVTPSSPSPYYLWVSLDTKHPKRFQVKLESEYWSNRRATVTAHSGANASMRAEIFLHRLTSRTIPNEEDGTVWIERRRHFLGREYASGERVGRYSVAYLTRLDHE